MWSGSAAWAPQSQCPFRHCIEQFQLLLVVPPLPLREQVCKRPERNSSQFLRLQLVQPTPIYPPLAQHLL